MDMAQLRVDEAFVRTHVMRDQAGELTGSERIANLRLILAAGLAPQLEALEADAAALAQQHVESDRLAWRASDDFRALGDRLTLLGARGEVLHDLLDSTSADSLAASGLPVAAYASWVWSTRDHLAGDLSITLAFADLTRAA